MTLAEDVPVHAPVVSVPVAGLSGGLCGAEDAKEASVSITTFMQAQEGEHRRTGRYGLEDR